MKPYPPQHHDPLRAVRERWRLVLLVMGLATGLAVGVSLGSDKQYDATAQLLLRGEEPINSLLDPASAGQSNDPERDLNTEVELIKVGPTADAVRRALGLRRSTETLLEQVQTEAGSTSDIVRVTVRDRDRVLAARIANTFAESYVRFRVNSARERYLHAADLAQRQLSALSPVDRRSIQGRDLRARKRELEIASALQTGGAELVRRADVPTTASRPRPKLSGALGMVLGLMLGVGAALALNLVDRRFKNERELEEFFDLPVLAAIPRPGRRGHGLNDSGQREAYGLLAANLNLTGPGQLRSVLMITSPGPGDGKTSATLGIARAYARLGLTVVAIEADLRRPAFGQYTDLSASAGLTGVLAGDPVAQELVWLDPDTLKPCGRDSGAGGAIGLLPAGELPDNPQRALANPAMNLVIEVANALADVVLIDTAPLGTVNDAAMLARLVEGVVVVTRLNHTTKDAARRTSRTLGNLAADELGLVVTDASGGQRHANLSTKQSDGLPRVEHARSGVQNG
jgi:succinoglycan biosynthesis transport protein ExoP